MTRDKFLQEQVHVQETIESTLYVLRACACTCESLSHVRELYFCLSRCAKNLRVSQNKNLDGTSAVWCAHLDRWEYDSHTSLASHRIGVTECKRGVWYQVNTLVALQG